MGAHTFGRNALQAASGGFLKIADPGNGNTIDVTVNGGTCLIAIAASTSETRLLPSPATAGLNVGTTLTVMSQTCGSNGLCRVGNVEINKAGGSQTFRVAATSATGLAWVADSSGVGIASQGPAGASGAAGTLTAAMIAGGLVTADHEEACTYTLPDPALMVAAGWTVDDMSKEWSFVDTSTGFTATIATYSSGGRLHGIVGKATVATLTSGRFITIRSSATVFSTIRLA